MKDLGKIFRYVIPYWRLASLNVLLNTLSVIFGLFSLTMVIPFLGILFGTQELITTDPGFTFSVTGIKNYFYYELSNIIIHEGKSQALLMVSIVVVAMSLMKNLFKYLAMYNLSPLRNGVVRDIRNKLFGKIMNLPIGYFTEERKGDIMSRMTNDVQEVEWSILSSLEALFRDPLNIIIYLITLLYMSPLLTLLILILLPISGYLIGLLGRTLRKTSASAQQQIGQLMSEIEEVISGLRIIKAFTAEDRVNQNFTQRNQNYTSIMIRIFRRRYLASPISEFLGTAVVVAAMYFGGKMVMSNDGTMNAETLIGYLAIFSQIISPAKSFTTAYYNIQKGLASAERIQTVLEARNPIEEKKDAQALPAFNKSIEYRNVTFRYQKEDVLKDINLTIEKGEAVALVGQSGSGKSTMVDLLPRFWDAVSGEILIDGIPIRDIRIQDLRNLMGIVSQESILFNDTIYNNIAFGMAHVTEEDVIKAAKVANAHEFIINTEQGYQTNIGDRGSKLSGGQRQRLSIARAVLKNPPILILDEATSALDTESERLVQDALTRLMKNRTSIVIAHRLSTVRDVDEICVMEKGVIIERGKHEALLALDGAYKKYHNIQMIS